MRPAEVSAKKSIDKKIKKNIIKHINENKIPCLQSYGGRYAIICDNTRCRDCQFDDDNWDQTVERWKTELYKNYRTPQKKDLKWKKTLLNLRGNHGNQDKS